jgi:hypothetical protein
MNRKKLLTDAELVSAINKALSTNYNVRSIMTLRHARKIPYTRLGYRTLRYDVDKVLHALTRNEVKAVETWG